MNDSYVEILVKRHKKPVHTAIQIGLLVITVILCLLGLILHWILLIPGIILLVLDNFLLPLLNLEYEYLYVSGELTVDKIMGKNKRKNCFTGEMDKIELVAPLDSQQLAEYKNMQCVEKDYTSGNEEARVFACIYRGEKEVWKVLFEPNDKMLELMYLTAPRKIVRKSM